MNLNYSYRALLITSLLFGILFLAFESIILSKYELVEEEGFDIEYTEEDLLLEEELASLLLRDTKIETNRAFNEAEEFISDVENEREVENETLEEKKQAQEISINDSKNSNGNLETRINKKVNSQNKRDFSSPEINEISASNSSKRNSTVSYRLINRSILVLPNPVYTCNSFGKVVVNIEVSETGKVKNATYSKSGSTTTNECLIDNAIIYAKNAKFSTDAQKTTQLGTITYNFPGQQ